MYPLCRTALSEGDPLTALRVTSRNENRFYPEVGGWERRGGERKGGGVEREGEERGEEERGQKRRIEARRGEAGGKQMIPPEESHLEWPAALLVRSGFPLRLTKRCNNPVRAQAAAWASNTT